MPKCMSWQLVMDARRNSYVLHCVVTMWGQFSCIDSCRWNSCCVSGAEGLQLLGLAPPQR